MKKVVIALIFVLAIFASIGVSASAEEVGTSYVITQKEEKYVLEYGADAVEYGSLSECLADITDPSEIRFLEIDCAEHITLPKGKYILSGNLNSGSNVTIPSGASVHMKDVTLSMEDVGYIRIKGGSLTIESSSITGKGRLITLDYSASSYLEVVSGVISGDSESAIINIENGRAIIIGADIENKSGVAIRNDSELVLRSSPKISGADFDIFLESPISLGAESHEFYPTDTLSVQYKATFTEGTLTEVFYDTTARTASKLRLFDENGKEEAITHFENCPHTTEQNFAGVYLPHKVKFFVGNTLICEQHLLSGEKITFPIPDEVAGYRFDNWYKDRDGNDSYSHDSRVYSSFSLYGVYDLLPPEFSISSLEFTYDGSSRQLGFESVTHPLPGGFYTYTWYKNGEEISNLSELSLKNASDSGIYSCKIEYSFGGKTASILAENIKVNIKRKTLALPIIPSLEYTGIPQHPSISQSASYKIAYDTGVEVGAYPVILTLTDPDNYSWPTTEGNSVTVYFEIKKAENVWTQEPTVRNTYVGFPLEAYGTARFGEITYLYSATENGLYSADPPKSPGSYFLKMAVAESKNYTGIISSPMPFSILPEQVVGMKLIDMPHVVEYSAFDHFSPAGITVAAIYNSGREEVISTSRLTFIYNDKSSLRVGDSGVIVEYMGATLMIPLTVNPLSYDLSGFEFIDEAVIYDGNYHTSKAIFPDIVGLDGIPLNCEIVGGGTSVGTYTLTAVFSTESRDYVVPNSLTVTLTVSPLERELIWSGNEFTYDGTPKLPTAYFIDASGTRRDITVCGSAVFAGEEYEATVAPYSNNYVFVNPTFHFIVKKADYDTSAVSWSSGSFVYSGEAVEVTLNNLPDGILVVGYTDNRGTEVGKYTATASVKYDDKNYNHPTIPSYEWEITPAEYDLSGFEFLSSEYEYSGEEQFPRLEGNMPQGMDGIPLVYSFSCGAKNVKDGKVEVTVTFATDSKNYIAPAPIVVTVTVVPKGIYVIWTSDTFVYDGTAHAPKAESPLANILVKGGKSNAGIYTAEATSDDPNYTVINATHTYEIKKAENSWLSPLSIADFFESRDPVPSARSYYGTPQFAFYEDLSLTTPIDDFAPGTYYVVATVPESDNFLLLTSLPVAVTCKEVVTVGIRTKIKGELVAFSGIDESTEIYVLYNDGTEKLIPVSSAIVEYQNGDSLRCADTHCTVSYLGYSETISITVTPATYDMSNVVWNKTEVTYDGKSHSPVLLSLPDGITVYEYIGGEAVSAGEYVFSAVLSYDKENYLPPVIPECVFKIKKATVTEILDITVEYSGNEIIPRSTDLYNAVYSERIINSGEYSIEYHLTDPNNYMFENLTAMCKAKIVITPRTLNVKISDYKLYALESEIKPEYTIDGNIVDGDDVKILFFVEDGKIYARADNPDYYLLVECGTLEKIPYPNESTMRSIIISSVIVAAFIILLMLVIKKRGDILDHFCMLRTRSRSKGKLGIVNNAPETPSVINNNVIIIPSLEAPKSETSDKVEEPSGIDETIERDDSCIESDIDIAPNDPQGEEVEEDIKTDINDETLEVFDSIDNTEEVDDVNIEEPKIEVKADYADSMIADSIARKMIKDESEAIETSGNAHSIINVDTLSRNFIADDRVDVNILKKKSLVPYDTNYIKVLARGAIDKPLHVFANDFSLSAVKMILLSGGEAIRITSEKEQKRNKNNTNK